MKQLIYRMEREGEYEVGLPPEIGWVGCATPWDVVRNGSICVRRHGAGGTLKMMIRLATAIRSYDCLTDGQEIVSECFSTVGRCRFYDVERNAVVLGPVWTHAAWRGRGLATELLKRAINRHVMAGRRIFYVDTSERNGAMQRVCEMCGFGAPYEKAEKWAQK